MSLRSLRTPLLAASGIVLAVGLTACGGSSGGAPSSSASGASSSVASSASTMPDGSSDSGAPIASGNLDCQAASNAMGDYGSALADMAGTLATDDKDKAVTAADAFVQSVDNLQAAFPGAPESTGVFFTVSKQVADTIKQAAAGTAPLSDLGKKLQEQLGSEEFSNAGDAIEKYFRASCPDTEIPGADTPASSGAPSISGDGDNESSESANDGDQ